MKKTLNRVLWTMAIFCMALACATGIQAVTLDEILRDVVVTNPRILEKQKAYNTALAEHHDARSGYFPKVIFTGDVGYKNYQDSGTRYKNENDGFYDVRLTVSQLLYDWGKTSSLDAARKNYMLAALYAYVGMASQVTYDTIVAYLNVLKYNELRELAMENVLTHEQLLESVRMQVEKGKKGRSELERINGRMASAQSRLILRQNDFKRAEYTLHKLVGRFTVMEEMAIPGMDAKELPGTLKEALDLQIKFNPQLREAFYSTAQKEWEYRNKRKEYMGRLSLEGLLSAENEFDNSDEYEMDAKIGLRYHHTLFDAGKSHRVQAAASLLHREQQKSFQLRRTLLKDIQLSWSAHKLITEQIGVLKKNLYFTTKSLETYKKEFVLGRRSLINILDAQNENQYVNEQLINAVYSREMEKYKILLSEGVLLSRLDLLNPLAQSMIEHDRDYKPLSRDTLPLSQDSDGDKILDHVDVSMNSLPGDQVNTLGISRSYNSSYIYEAPEQAPDEGENVIGPKDSLVKKPMRLNITTMFDFDAFLPKGTGLTDTMTKSMMKELVRQARTYSTQMPLYITVSTNEYDDPDRNYTLGLERAYTLKRILQQNRIEDKSLFVFANTNAPKGHNILRLQFSDKEAAYQKQYITHSLNANIFATGESRIQDFEKFNTVLDHIVQNQGKAEIILYSNELPNMEAGRQLGLKRAEVIRKYLIQKGVAPHKVVLFSWGAFQEDPILPESWKIDQFLQYVLR